MSDALVRVLKSVPIVAVGPLLWATPSRPQGDGVALYKSKCAACHGPDGKAETTMGKTLKIRDLGSPTVQSQSDAQLTEIVTKGKNKMPAFEGKVTSSKSPV